MAAPGRIEEWFQQVPEVLLEEGWEAEIEQPSCSLCHCEAPWGGSLIRIRLEVQLENPPENPAMLLVRPEVRALQGKKELSEVDDLRVLETASPGDSLLKQVHTWGLSSLCSSFMEASNAPKDLGDAQFVKVGWQRVTRDFPDQGDSALTFAGEKPRLLLCRPKGEPFRLSPRGTETSSSSWARRYEVNAIFQVDEEQWAAWTSIHLRLLLESASRAAQWFVNRPGVVELRRNDAEFYTVLTVQSCRRGLPLIPLRPSEAAPDAETVRIQDGQWLGLDRWTRFWPQRYGRDRFSLATYLRTFLKILDIHDFEAYDDLDGQRLVTFQCVVRKDQWEAAKDRFLTAFLIQKKAYRHANGGSSAPSLRADAKPRFVPEEGRLALQERQARLQEEEASQHRVVVRKTFLDVDEPSSPDSADNVSAWWTARTARKHRTCSALQVNRLELSTVM